MSGEIEAEAAQMATRRLAADPFDAMVYQLVRDVVCMTRVEIAHAIEALHIPGAPGVGDETYNSAIADAARIARDQPPPNPAPRPVDGGNP